MPRESRKLGDAFQVIMEHDKHISTKRTHRAFRWLPLLLLALGMGAATVNAAAPTLTSVSTLTGATLNLEEIGLELVSGDNQFLNSSIY